MDGREISGVCGLLGTGLKVLRYGDDRLIALSRVGMLDNSSYGIIKFKSAQN